MAAWRVTYTPGEWLVLSGPTMLVVMLPAPPRMSELVNTLWDDIRAAGSVEALLKVIGEYGLDQMSDFAAFFWDAEGLHGMARGQLTVTDADTGDTVVSGSDVVTWREEPLGTARHLRVDMQQVHEGEFLQLPLMVGAVMASAIHLSTDLESSLQFPQGSEEQAAEQAGPETVGLGDETEMEPFCESSATPVETDEAPELVADPEPASDFDDDIPFWSPPDDENTDFITPIPPPVSALTAVRHDSQVGDDDTGTIFSSNLAATHKPAAEPGEQRQVLAVPCARGHANPPGSRACRICSAPVDSAKPRLINRPALAGVHSNHGDFADVQVAVVVGRSPDASQGPRGAHLMRVPSPSSDISRSHLIVAARDWSVVVTDLHSTNGTTVVPVGEQSFVLANGESVQVDLGTVLDLGDGVSLRIEPPRG